MLEMPAQNSQSAPAAPTSALPPIRFSPTAQQRCLAKRKWCVCRYRFKASDSPASEKDLSVRLDPGYDFTKLGHCPKCGRPRQLCGDVAVTGKLVCRRHGGKAGRRPMDPVVEALDDDALDIIAAMEAKRDKDLDHEFYVAKYLLKHSLGVYDPEVPSPDLAGRFISLLEQLVSIQERQNRLNAPLLDADAPKIEFSDPRVQFLLQEKFRELETATIRGTLRKVFQSLGTEQAVEEVYQALPVRLQEYVKSSFQQVKETEAVVITPQGNGGDDGQEG